MVVLKAGFKRIFQGIFSAFGHRNKMVSDSVDITGYCCFVLKVHGDNLSRDVHRFKGKIDFKNIPYIGAEVC